MVCQQLVPLLSQLSFEVSCQVADIDGCVDGWSHGRTAPCLPLRTKNVCPGYSVMVLQLFLQFLPLLEILKDDGSSSSKNIAHGSGHEN